MKTRTTLIAAAVVLAFAQLPLTAAAQSAKPGATASSPAAAAATSTAKDALINDQVQQPVGCQSAANAHAS